MKRILNPAIRLFFTVAFLYCTTTIAQDMQQQNSAVFEKVQEQIKKQDATALYALTNEDFKSHIGWVNFENFSKYGLFAQGAISTTSLLNYSDGISTYKLTFPSGDFSLKLKLDKEGKINYFLFKKMDAATSVADKTTEILTSNPLETDFDRALDDAAMAYLRKGNTVGLCIGFLQKGIMRMYNYGATEKGGKEMPSAHFAFEIGSITKTFTATLLAWYANAGKVSLNDPITKYLPDSVKKNKALAGITLQMLSNHTSGLARIPDNLLQGNANMLNPYKNYDNKKLFSYLKHCTPATQPGNVLSYSNTGAGLLGVILTKVSGKSYEQMVDLIIADPLKMEHTGLHFIGDHAPHIIKGYDYKGALAPLWNFNALSGAGALLSTSSDLLKYAEANLDLNTSPLGRALALTHDITYTDGETGIGLGWFKKQINDHTIYWHNGATGGCSSYVAFMPGTGIAISVLANSSVPVDEVALTILGAIKQ